MSKLVSFNEALARLRHGNKPVARMTLMNWVQRGHLQDMRPKDAKGRRMPIYLDEEEVIRFAQSKGYEWLPLGQHQAPDEKTLLWEELQKLAMAVAKHEQQVLEDRARLATLRKTIPMRSTIEAQIPPLAYASPLERALATAPTSTARRLTETATSPPPPETEAKPSDALDAVWLSADEYPRWSKYNPSEQQIPYPAFWVGRGRVPREYLSSFVPCARAHGISKNTAGSMRAGWLSRQEKGLPQRFHVTYIKDEDGRDGQMLLAREDAIQVVQQLQKEARDKLGKWDAATLCQDPLCPVCCILDWNPNAEPAQLITVSDLLAAARDRASEKIEVVSAEREEIEA